MGQKTNCGDIKKIVVVYTRLENYKQQSSMDNED